MIGKQATIYTDGSCIGNPGPGGWAAVILCDGKQIELSGGASDTTNNRMELMGLIQGLKALDKDTTGLLLLTTDGELNHRLLAPARHVDKTYLATLDKPVGEKEAAAFASGLSLSDFEAAPADLTPLPDNQARVTIHEGKFHQVKRMFAAVEREVLTLHRETFGSLALDEALPCGQWRELTEAEASALYRDAQMEEKHG